MDKCVTCGQVASYVVQEITAGAGVLVEGASVNYCNAHMHNTVTDGTKAWKVTKLGHTMNLEITSGTGPYREPIKDTRRTL